jgi:uncharacterized membrane protein YphA (DoxX/SURF4 family)
MRTAVDESVIGLAEIAGGLALLSGWFVPLGLAMLVPVTAGIVAFAIKTGGEEVTVGFVLAAAHLFLAWEHRDRSGAFELVVPRTARAHSDGRRHMEAEEVAVLF